ncbi:hypothetical protein [Membranihabitans marinus]|uniref:hypothetical protein n=1 Tax=Membranihabitans marinus TaxID=1227546 RepID=UPI001F37BFC4|nr:hypothetical protein [Membranihabitans marinus]
MKKLLLPFILFLPFLLQAQIDLKDVEIQKIWDKGDHNAFTDLLFYKGKFYCSFREGSGHVPGKEDVDGTVRILSSEDGKRWASVAHLKTDGYDLRDPKMSILPDGRMMVIIGGSDYTQNTLHGRLPHVSFSSDGIKFTDPKPIVVDESIKSTMDWVWRVTWHKGLGYAVNYQFDDAKRIYVVKTTDGIHYDNVSELFVSGRPNEATVRFSENDEMFIYLRREEQDKEGLLLKSDYPYKEYTWVNLEHRLGGPNFIFLPNTDQLILGTRLYAQSGASTGIFLSDYHGYKKLLIEFPSGGDTSYPGFVWRDGLLWVSYYSSHEGKTSIYLAKIKQEDIYKSLMD